MKGLDPDLRALQEVRDHVARAKAACKSIRTYSQEQVDRLCKAMADAALAAAHDLARMAVEETGIGRVHYKVLKNILGSEGVWASIENERTVGFVSKDEQRGVYEVATPIGVIAGIVPTTNPTSTAMYKALISVKGRNAIVISPHPRAKRCIGETAEIMRRAIERAGGPPDLVMCLSNPTIESTGALMKHRDTSLILATGGGGLVRAAYSSGKPAYGVGPGNVPAYVDRSADVARVAADVVASQSFDNGTLCCSEQALVLDRPIADQLLSELQQRGAHLCNEEETRKLSAYAVRGKGMNPDVVGLDPWRVAEAAGFQVPRHTSILLAHQGGVGAEWPLSYEILCPLLSVHVVDGWEEGCKTSMALLHQGGLGHTLGVHARDEQVLEAFFLEKPASRIVCNGPTSQGAVGFSTNLVPAMSLGCGPQAGNITSDNITARHMINIKRVAFPRREWPELSTRMHERAMELTGQGAPRGSGLDGDPALGGSTRVPSAPAREWKPGGSSWQGNPAMSSAVSPAASPAGRATSERPASRPAPTPMPTPRPAAAPTSAPAPARSAPTFTRPGAARSAAPVAASGAAPAAAPAPRTPVPAAAAPPSPSPGSGGANVIQGGALNASEIHAIMQHAGSGCPMGPCKGCPHQDVRTGSCTA